MAKLKHAPIVARDLVEFLDSQSDFAFEIRVLNSLIALGFECEHGGTYDDPVTKKPRAFDIRATRRFEKRFIRLAVECKNVREHFPLLISCLPRRSDEAFHEIVVSVDPKTHPFETPAWPHVPAMTPQSRNVRLTGTQSLYEPNLPVGKSCEQVGRTSDGISASDSDLYEKWSQALSSVHDLTYLACNDGIERTRDVAMSLVMPVVAVPDGRLWVAQFDASGARVGDPEQADRCSYFVGRPYFHHSLAGGEELTISHLEFVTLRGLASIVVSLCGSEQQLARTFPLRPPSRRRRS